MTEKEKEAIETMQHWIEYEKENKEKINKADELIQMQETILNLIQKQEKIIDRMAEVICRLDTFNNYDTWNNDIEETKQYFERQVEENE